MVRMRFKEDMYYNRDVIYTKDRIHNVPDNMVARWLKRGGEIVEGEVPEEKPRVRAKDKKEKNK